MAPSKKRKPKTAKREPFVLSGVEVPAGERRTVEVPLPQLYTHTAIPMPVQVLHGQEEGPCLFLTAALHGDEINGMEIIRRVVDRLDPARIRGTVLAVPVVNVFGLITQSRYLPDRRDLNRSFPGSAKGSLAARLAYTVRREIVRPCTHGIDLHTAGMNRTNLPQVRAEFDDPETRKCAVAFGAPVIVNSAAPEGSLRGAAAASGVHVLVYEAGETLRFNADAIETGVSGVLRVMTILGMRIGRSRILDKPYLEVRSSKWVRARSSGILRLSVAVGEHVRKDQTLGAVSDTFEDNKVSIVSPWTGVVIGQTVNPLVYRGDAVVHVGMLE
jgi:hypothetical protein